MADVSALIDRYGRTYAEQAGITLSDKPSPLYRLLVLTVLLSKPITAGVACNAARELSDAGLRTPSRMRASTWRQRVDALGRGGYRRFDESTAALLGEGASLLHDRWDDDMRELHREGGDADGIETLLREVPGIGPTGASIYLREVQGVWRDVAPYVDDKAVSGAEALGLPPRADELAALAPGGETGMVRLVTACVRVGLEGDAQQV